MTEYFQNLPKGMEAEIDEVARICYIRHTPHTLINCLEKFVSGWRDVLYLNMEDFHEKAKKDSRPLTDELFYIMVQADQAGVETLVYQDAEDNVRPSIGYDPVNVVIENRPVEGVSLGMNAEGHNMMVRSGVLTGLTPPIGTNIYITNSPKDE
jgi:hypothetical protein